MPPCALLKELSDRKHATKYKKYKLEPFIKGAFIHNSCQLRLHIDNKLEKKLMFVACFHEHFGPVWLRVEARK